MPAVFDESFERPESLGASLSCLVAWDGAARLSERVGSVHRHVHYACASLVQNSVCMRM